MSQCFWWAMLFSCPARKMIKGLPWCGSTKAGLNLSSIWSPSVSVIYSDNYTDCWKTLAGIVHRVSQPVKSLNPSRASVRGWKLSVVSDTTGSARWRSEEAWQNPRKTADDVTVTSENRLPTVVGFTNIQALVCFCTGNLKLYVSKFMGSSRRIALVNMARVKISI